MAGPEWEHLVRLVDALAVTGNSPMYGGFLPTPGGWNCQMQGPLDMDVLAPLIESDDHPIEIVQDEDRVWCRHCSASIAGPAGLPLTRERLMVLLERERINPAAYCLDGGHPDERYVVDRRGREWVTYYSERGLESGLRSFRRAADAYEHLLDQLTRDPTTRIRLE